MSDSGRGQFTSGSATSNAANRPFAPNKAKRFGASSQPQGPRRLLGVLSEKAVEMSMVTLSLADVSATFRPHFSPGPRSTPAGSAVWWQDMPGAEGTEARTAPMYAARIWHPGLRIVEFGATSGALGDALVRAGYQHYLAVTPNGRALARIAAAHPRLQTRLTVAKTSSALRSNNGEVLVLQGARGLYLARFRLLRQAHYVALPVAPSAGFVAAFLVGLVQWLFGRLNRPSVVHLGHQRVGTFRLIAFGVRRRHVSSARRYIPHTLGIERFLRRLNRQRVRYAVLRWFESLPVLPPGEDLTLLVDDADLPTVAAMLDEGPGLQPIDLYSATGLPGADYHGMPYFPPHVAGQLLDGARPKHDLCWVPSAEDHFRSLAYHALYHEGFASGLASEHASRRHGPPPAHDYGAILKKLAPREGIDVPTMLDDPDRYLDTQGWRPPDEMLARLARHNRWIRSLLAESTACVPDDHSGPQSPPRTNVGPRAGRRAA